MKFYCLVLLAALVATSSCSKDDDGPGAQELIIGKWVYQNPGAYSPHNFYIFREDGTGASGIYNTHGGTTPNPAISPFRYAIHGNKIGFCYDETHTHPVQPGEDCLSGGDVFQPFHVDKTSLYFDYLGKEAAFTRVEKWSDAGLPDKLLPQ